MGKTMRACSDAVDVVFYINGTRHQVEATSDLTLSLYEYLRLRTSFKGTKLSCGEGGCGACAVTIETYDPLTDATRTTSINSCLCLVGSLDGHAITTVEGLGNSTAGFHKVQEAFASHHASQCGYCTPGFVVATHVALERCRAKGVPATRELLMQGLDGNLCRCTGYRPILDACRTLVADSDVEDLCSKTPSCSMGGACAHASSPSSGMQCSAFPEDLKQHVKRKASGGESGRQLRHVPGLSSAHKGIWKAPASVRELLEDLDNNQGKSVRLLAGNTGYGIYKDWPDEDVIINVNAIPDLHNLQRTQGGLEVGACATIERLIQAFQDDESAPAWQQAAKHLLRIAGSHVRAAATIGGHLALFRAKHLQSNLVPVLMALNAQIGIATLNGTRWLCCGEFLEEEVDLGLGRSALVVGVRIPAAKEGLWLWAHKVSRRYYNAHALVDVTVSAVFDPPLRESEPSADTKITEAKIVVSTPTVVAEGAQGRPGSKCGPDRVEWRSVRCGCAEVALTGQQLHAETLVEALEQLQHDISPASDTDADKAAYRGIAEGLLLQALGPLVAAATACPADSKLHSLLTAHNLGLPGVPVGTQSVPDYSRIAPPVHSPVEKDRVRLQASGEALYTSDMGGGKRELYTYPVLSTQALATLVSVDASKVLEEPGVVAFITAADVPGENRVKGGATDGLLLAEGKVEYVGQPIALVVAATQRAAEGAARRVAVQYGHPKELGAPVLTIPDAIAAGSFYPAPGTPGFVAGTHPGRVRVGDPDAAMALAPNRITAARYSLPSQSHFYMETQNAVAEPDEDGAMRVWSSTQTMDGVQSAVARVLGVPAHSVNVVVRRLGGAYGGKVARSMPVAAAAALAARVTGERTRLALNRNDDMRMNGGRSETMVEYDVGFDDEGRVTALNIRGYFLCGAEMNLGFNDMVILASGVDQAYAFPAMDLDLNLVRTNLAPRTIVRGPGFTNSVMIIEQIMEHVASHLGADPLRVRQLNFLPKYPFPAPASLVLQPTVAATTNGSQPPNGQEPASGKRLTFSGCGRMSGWSAAPEKRMMYTSLGRCFEAELFTLPVIWEELQKSASYAQRLADIHDYNKTSPWRKRGIAMLPCRFDAAPPAMTSAVSIYYDGSVLVVPGGIEMGQGLHTKIKQVASYQLGLLLPEQQQPLPMSLLRIADSSSETVPNGGPSWGSTSSESTVAAVSEACKQLVANLTPHLQVGGSAEETWKGTVASVHADIGYAPAATMLSAYGFYDGTVRNDVCAPRTTGAGALGVGGHPLAYCTFGAACTEVELDSLTGEQRILRSDILFDCGRSMNPALDMGQVEGAFVMGLGLHTSEEVIIDSDTGRLVADGTWEYKIPAASCIPQQLNVTFLKGSPNRRGVLGSKASGEPSLLLAVSVLHALRMAANAARRDPARRAAGPGPASAAAPACGGEAEGAPPPSGRPGALLSSMKSPKTGAPASPDSAPAQELGMQEDGFLTMAGPATVGRLKAACGSFSAAQIIKSHMPDNKDAASEPAGWVLLSRRTL